jgi:acetyl esterase/lipase
MRTPEDDDVDGEDGAQIRNEEHIPWLGLLAASWSPGSVRQHAMQFGEDPRQVVIAFVPKKPQPGPWAFFLFGGDWTSGSARLWSFAGNWFAHHGVPVVLGGYRLAPAHPFPAALDDALAGFAFSIDHADELGIAGRPAVLSGASSGGHLAALAAIQLARNATVANQADSCIHAEGLLLVNAPLDLPTAHTPKGIAAIEALTGHKRPWPEADPLTWLSAEPLAAEAIPRTLIVQGEIDELVPPVVAEHFAEALNSLAPAQARIVHPEWKEHVDLTRLFLDKDPALTEFTTNWLRSIVTPTQGL